MMQLELVSKNNYLIQIHSIQFNSILVQSNKWDYDLINLCRRQLKRNEMQIGGQSIENQLMNIRLENKNFRKTLFYSSLEWAK
jgi:hypothetical protein